MQQEIAPFSSKHNEAQKEKWAQNKELHVATSGSLLWDGEMMEAEHQRGRRSRWWVMMALYWWGWSLLRIMWKLQPIHISKCLMKCSHHRSLNISLLMYLLVDLPYTCSWGKAAFFILKKNCGIFSTYHSMVCSTCSHCYLLPLLISLYCHSFLRHKLGLFFWRWDISDLHKLSEPFQAQQSG